MLTSVAYANNKQELLLYGVQRTANVRSDFVERFTMFKSTYAKALTKEEKSHIAKEFLMHCTDEEITLVRSIIGDVLHQR